MGFFTAIIMGVLQGISEFLPISSSGHLALFQYFGGGDASSDSQMLFTVLLHLGTLVAVFVAYWKDIVELVQEMVRWVRCLINKEESEESIPSARRMILMIIVATLPLFLVLLVKDHIDNLFSNPVAVSFALIFTGFLLFFSDRIARGHKTAKSATMKDTILIGVAQAIATIPGISRAGSTISAGMILGFDRSFAVRFSFLLSIPAILGANILEIGDAVQSGVDVSLIPVYIVGMIVAAVVGYFAIQLVKMLTQKGKFGYFAYYCWAVGAGSLLAVAITSVWMA